MKNLKNMTIEEYAKRHQAITDAVKMLCALSEELDLTVCLFVGLEDQPYKARLITGSDGKRLADDSDFAAIASILSSNHTQAISACISKLNVHPKTLFGQNFVSAVFASNLAKMLGAEDSRDGIAFTSDSVKWMANSTTEELVSTFLPPAFDSVDSLIKIVVSETGMETETIQAGLHMIGFSLIDALSKAAVRAEGKVEGGEDSSSDDQDLTSLINSLNLF